MTDDNINEFMNNVVAKILTGHTTEHSFRPTYQDLFKSLSDIIAINEPKRSENGAPDFVFLDAKNKDKILGYAEMKDIDKNLDDIEKSEQMDRYKGYKNIFLTNNLDWRFFRNGEKYFEIKIGEYDTKSKTVTKIYSNHFAQLSHELQAFFDQTPESITNGRRLAEIMGGKARRIRENIVQIFADSRDNEIKKIYDMMKELLVSDLTEDHFADMYSQTLVYGLFVARYNDNTQDSFSRSEARDLVPATNPFLREFFDHITGSNFNKSLSYIVDELCEVFEVSDIKHIVHKHLKITDDGSNDIKDPIIHFYEDFLASYDAKLRKQMGAYYTPIPVVQYIIRSVDRILKEDFMIADGIADNEKIKYAQSTDPYQVGKSKSSKTYYQKTIEIPRVQILDPAVGTATFLNEIIKYIHKERFSGQQGLWESYANENILPRLNGFELMMTPYTIAHLKLGMTLSELGATKLKDRLRVFLTNTLTEGIEKDLPLFALIGLTKVVAEESNLAAEVKNDRPMMVIVGNPPYSVSSNNKSDFARDLVAPYKKDLNERKINLDDDYIKFLAFSERMIAKSGRGVVAMITNNSYIDGLTHREMRHHLRETFDKIYILDLHGNAKKKETSPDGSIDQNVFNIMQGVSIIVAIKTGVGTRLADVYHAEIHGTRNRKFDRLNTNDIEFSKVDSIAPNHFFIPKDNSLTDEYEQGININDLFIVKSSGFRSGFDSAQVTWNRKGIEDTVEDLVELPEQEFRDKYSLKDGRNHNYKGMKADVKNGLEPNRIIRTIYRPFDIRWTYYSYKSSGFAAWPRNSTMNNFVNKTNMGLIYKRGYIENKATPIGVTNLVSHERTWSRAGMQGADSVAPLYIYYDDGTKNVNFDKAKLSSLTKNLTKPYAPEDIINYIYGKLHSTTYNEKYREFINIDFPRVPIPSQQEFDRLLPLGKKLRELHLMEADTPTSTTYPESGSNVVDKVEFTDNKVFININQYFGNVTKTAWDFFIGGYQPAQKWLKDRKGRNLSTDEIIHYQKIIAILNETDQIMTEIG